MGGSFTASKSSLGRDYWITWFMTMRRFVLATPKAAEAQ